MLDQRQSIRRRALLSGRIRVAKLPLWSADCSVRNVSDGGMGVTIPVDTIVPDTFEFSMSGRASRKARLVWMRDGRAGLALIETRINEAPTIWTGRCRRASSALLSSAPSDLERFEARIEAIKAKGRADGSKGFTRP